MQRQLTWSLGLREELRSTAKRQCWKSVEVELEEEEEEDVGLVEWARALFCVV